MAMKTDDDGNPILDQFNEEGFVDLVFRMTNRRDDATHYRFHLLASHRGDTVGMEVAVVKGIQGGFDSDMNVVKGQFHRPGVRFLRSGQESDRLISAIGGLYGRASAPRRMVEEETYTAIALHQGNLDFDNERVKLKLFGGDGEPFDEQAYYESYFHVDLTGGFAWWNEKDPDYREPLMRGLTAQD